MIQIDPTKVVDEENLTPIPQTIDMKPEFEDRYKIILGPEYESFLHHSFSYIRKAIRVNTLKISVSDLKARLEKDWILEPVPWCEEGFFITYRHGERYDIGNLIEHQLGYFYVQDPASMIPPLVLGPRPGEIVLDLCAAPGSKTTQIAAMMQNEGVLFANDFSGDRLKPLGLNLTRMGIINTIVLLRHNTRLGSIFDRVLVDAPCSATGTIRRSLKTLQMWSPGLVRKMASEQRKILEQGWNVLKPGGTLVYSTCTLEPEEDEGMVSEFLKKHPDADVLDIDLQIQRAAPILEWDGKRFDPRVAKCLRIYPQSNDTEGFFVVKLQKGSHQEGTPQAT